MEAYSVINSKLYNQYDSAYTPLNKNYHFRTSNNNNYFSLALSYTEPLGKRNIAEINFSFTNNNGRMDRKTYNYNPDSKVYDHIEDSLTDNFYQTNQGNRLGINYKGISKNLNYQFGVAVQQMQLKSNDYSKALFLSHRFINLLPAASFNYRLRPGKNLQVQYRSRSNQPDIRQLQNVTDITSYPYIQKGNPRLKQEYVHAVNLSYNSFSNTSLRSLFVHISYYNIRNKITSSIQQNAAEQILMPVNMNGAYNLNSSFGLGIPFKSWEGAALNTSTQIDFYRNVNLVNTIRNYTRDLTVSQDLMLNYNSGKSLDLGLGISASYNSVRYAIHEMQNTFYFTHSFSLNTSYDFAKGITISTNVDYTGYTGRINGFNQNYVLWNASFSKSFLRNNKGSLRLSINDILNSTINITRYKGDNYIEDAKNISLKRFGMLTFIYKLNKKGK